MVSILGLVLFIHYFPTSSFDIYITQEIQGLKMGNFASLMKFISIFGNPVILPFSILFTALFFFVTYNKRESLFTLTTIIPDLLNILIKILIYRPRPTLANAKILLKFTQSGFPSGHVVHYVVFFGLLLTICLINKTMPKFAKIFVSLFAVFLIFSISISRIYLGAHWATDVIGGYLFGFIYLGIILKFYLKNYQFKHA
jgi:undecaprenyl-diphosphatase